MSSVNVFQVAMDLNGPPGLTHPLLVEKYAWVDERLREMYNGYALTASNCDEYEVAGLLTENWAWVDYRLEQMCKISDDDFPLALTPLTWANYRCNANLECLEEEEERLSGHKRSRSESDISDYEEEVERAVKRLRCQSPLPTGKYINELFDNKIVLGNYDEEYELATEVSSIASVVVHYVTDDEDENVESTWGEEMEPFMMNQDYAVVSDYSDDESTVLDFCDSP